jgi:D-tyrosyl-tRNA(Tyr) deacylase
LSTGCEDSRRIVALEATAIRAIVQRVSEAGVSVDGQTVGHIDRGLLVYAGVAVDDEAADVEYLANKIRYLRIFPDAEGKLNLDVSQAGGSVLVVSNFSLQADTREGRRPSFTRAAPPEAADALYRQLCESLAALGLTVQTGRFRAMMAVTSINDGPLNVLLDSKGLF